ncbi:MAG TPA: acetyl-CoA C-acyltransferase, partial [Candidatus Thermoplasmatota archaeon]|nr:acetyl-CoA C-acyltransferase [Candidatus Thermoplasmatota archaeon]
MAAGRVVIASAVRTPIGKFKGGFTTVPAPRLGAIATKAALDRARVRPEQVTELFFGCVIQAGVGQNPARQVLLHSGIPPSVSATTLNMVCGSGMQAMAHGVRLVERDPEAIVVAGGMENMTRAPYLLPQARMGVGLGHGELQDSMLVDGLLDAYDGKHMGLAGEYIAAKLGITRADVDAFATRSHTRAARATEAGLSRQEIVPVEVELGPKRLIVDKDEGIRGDTSPEKLARLKPAFKADGVLTAGNASQISDGAS